MKINMFICGLLAIALLACGEPNNGEENNNPNNPNPEIPVNPDPEPEPEPIPLPNIPKEVPACSIAEFTNWQRNFQSGDVLGDFSGVCLNAQGTGLIGVRNDSGTLWNINFDGTREANYFLRTFKDMEGVTVDAENNIIYMCEEGNNFIWKAEEVDGKWTFGLVKKIDAGSYESNSGLEGITYHDGYLYVANQSPAKLFIYSIEHQAVAHSFTASFIKECFSDLWFDTTNNTLWAVDAWGNEIVNFTVWGDFIARFKASEVPWIEGICIDFANNKAWFACDSTGQLFSADIVRTSAAK